MERWVTSDTHFYHERILEYCQRPFDSVEEMNEAIIKNWNEVVARDDIIYVLGDFCFGNKEMLKNVVSRLNGRKILILGNHDRLTKGAYLDAGFETVTKCPMIIDADFILSHQPLQGDLGRFYNIHGHKHKLPGEAQFSPKHFDIGVDDHNFYPHKLDTVIKNLYKTKRKNHREKTIDVPTSKRTFWERIKRVFRAI